MKRLAITLLCLSAIACGPSEHERTEQAVQEAVRASMLDPRSAIFGEMSYTVSGNSGCVTVNGKNTLGGYTGNQQAIVRKNVQTGSWRTTTITDFSSHAECMTAIIGDRRLLIEDWAANSAR
jgi:hypothetical protein